MVTRVIVTAIALSVTAVAAHGQSPADPDRPTTRLPRLGGHAFVGSPLLTEPFIRTYLENTTGLGSAVNLRNVFYDLEGEPVVEVEGSLTFGLIGFTYQQTVRDWLAAWIGVGGAARIGSSPSTFLVEGIDTQYGFDIGWLLRLHETDASLLSGSFQLWNSDLTTINVLDFFEEGEPIVRDSHSVRTGGSLRWGYGFDPLWGLTVAGTLGWGESLDTRGENGWFGTLDGGISLNLNEAKGVPLGFVFGGKLATFPDTGDELSENGFGGFLRVAHTGREDFVFGADLAIERVPRTDLSQDVYIGSLVLNLRYFYDGPGGSSE